MMQMKLYFIQKLIQNFLVVKFAKKLQNVQIKKFWSGSLRPTASLVFVVSKAAKVKANSVEFSVTKTLFHRHII